MRRPDLGKLSRSLPSLWQIGGLLTRPYLSGADPKINEAFANLRRISLITNALAQRRRP